MVPIISFYLCGVNQESARGHYGVPDSRKQLKIFTTVEWGGGSQTPPPTPPKSKNACGIFIVLEWGRWVGWGGAPPPQITENIWVGDCHPPHGQNEVKSTSFHSLGVAWGWADSQPRESQRTRYDVSLALEWGEDGRITEKGCEIPCCALTSEFIMS